MSEATVIKNSSKIMSGGIESNQIFSDLEDLYIFSRSTLWDYHISRFVDFVMNVWRNLKSYVIVQCKGHTIGQLLCVEEWNYLEQIIFSIS